MNYFNLKELPYTHIWEMKFNFKKPFGFFN